MTQMTVLKIQKLNLQEAPHESRYSEDFRRWYKFMLPLGYPFLWRCSKFCYGMYIEGAHKLALTIIHREDRYIVTYLSQNSFKELFNGKNMVKAMDVAVKFALSVRHVFHACDAEKIEQDDG